MNQTAFGFLILCVITLVTGYAMAGPSDEKGWIACEKNADCTSVELGCWHWQPVNKKYTEAIKAAHPPVCAQSISASPQPTTSCVHHICVNDPHTAKGWPPYYQELARECQKRESPNCCMSSVGAMVRGNYQVTPASGCPAGYAGDSMRCIDSYHWCRPIQKTDTGQIQHS